MSLLDKIHEIIGPLAKDELNRLKVSIKRNGVISPVIVRKETGEIIDGKHRASLSKDYPKKELDLDEHEAARQVVSLNFARRHRSPEQIRELIKLLQREGFSQEEVGEMVGRTQSAVAMAKKRGKVLALSQCDNANTPPNRKTKLSKKDREEIEGRIKKGKETQQEIAIDFRVNRSRIAQIKKKLEKVESLNSGISTIDPDIITGDFRIEGKKVEDNSVDLIFTDPPYGEKGLELYSDLVIFAARVLKPGASLLTYAGQSLLPETFETMKEKGLKYWWTIGVKHGGHIQRFPGKYVYIGWKPILWFVKEKRRDQEFISDFFVGKEEKSHHEWEQGIEEAEYFIKQFVRKGQLVCDPMCGSGTICLAAKNFGAKYLGFEINSETAAKARNRIKEENS